MAGRYGKDFVRRGDGLETTRCPEPGEGFPSPWRKRAGHGPGAHGSGAPAGVPGAAPVARREYLPLVPGLFLPRLEEEGQRSAGRSIILRAARRHEPGFARYFRRAGSTVSLLPTSCTLRCGERSLRGPRRDHGIHPRRSPDDFDCPIPPEPSLIPSGDGGTGVPVDKSGGATFHLAGELLKEFYKGRAKRYERSNLGTTLFGALLFVPMVLLACFMGFPLASASGVAFTLAAISIIVFSTVLIWFALSGALRLFRGHRPTVLSVLRFVLAVALAFGGGVWLTARLRWSRILWWGSRRR